MANKKQDTPDSAELHTGKVYTIKTIKDITDIVTLENVSEICSDISLMLFKLATIKALDPNTYMDEFKWKDDGINKVDINITPVEK